MDWRNLANQYLTKELIHEISEYICYENTQKSKLPSNLNRVLKIPSYVPAYAGESQGSTVRARAHPHMAA